MQNQTKFMFTLAMLACVLTTSDTFAQRTTTRTERSSGNSEWVMSHEENGRGLQVRVKGNAEFNDEYSDLKSLSPNGSVRVRDSRGTQIRRLEIEADSNGNLKRTYWVNDNPHAFDAEAQKWMTALMLELVRQSGFDAEHRVAKIYGQGGANAVLTEIALIKGDYAKSLYFRHLLKTPSLDAASVRAVVPQIARDLSSAYEKRQALAAVPEKYLQDEAVLNELIAAAGTVNSDYERGQLLAVFLQGNTLTEPQLQAALKVIAGIGSDYEKAQSLLRLAKSQKLASAALPQLFTAINGIGSDYEQARVLLAFLKDDSTDAETMKRVIKASADITSDYEQARVLLRVAALNKDNEEVRKLLVEASKTIGSDYERGRVLSATFR
jgi:ribosome-binding factor A